MASEALLNSGVSVPLSLCRPRKHKKKLQALIWQVSTLSFQFKPDEPFSVGCACVLASPMVEAPMALAPFQLAEYGLEAFDTDGKHTCPQPPSSSRPPNHKYSPYSPSSRSVSSSASRHEAPGAIEMYLIQLGLRSLLLQRCLKHAAETFERDFIALLAVFRSHEVTRSNLRAMLAKYPPLVKLKAPQVERAFHCFHHLGFEASFVLCLFLKRPALLACDLEKVSTMIRFLTSMGMQKEDISGTLLCRPHILEHDVDIVKDIISALSKAKIPKTEVLRLLRRSPVVFNLSTSNNIRGSLKFWSSVGLEGKALCRAIVRRPNLLSYDVANMKLTYSYLLRWMSHDDRDKLITRFGELLSYDHENKLVPFIHYLLKLGVDEQDIGKVLVRRPQLMACSLAGFEKTVAYLKGLGVKNEMLGKMLALSPQVFTLNAEDKLKRAVEFFESIGLDREKDMGVLFSRSPQIFCCSIEKNLRPKFEFFLSTGIPKEDVSKMIALFPAMLGQNIEQSLLPKLNYLVREMKRPVLELIDFPQYFGYSLEKRVKPRHEIMVRMGLHKSLAAMLACTDSDFNKRYVARFSQSESLIVQSEELPVQSKKKVVSNEPKVSLDRSHIESKLVAVKDDTCEDQAVRRCVVPVHKETKGQCSKADGKLSNHNIQRASMVEKAVALSFEPGTSSEELLMQMKTLEVSNQTEGRMNNSGKLTNELLDPVAAPKEERCEAENEDLLLNTEKQAELYPSYFTTLYQNLSPCGIWIHAYKLEK